MQRALMLLIALFSFDAVKSNLEQYNLFRKANRQAQSGQHAVAARQYRQLLDRYPAGQFRCEASFNLACAEYGMKHYTRAAEQFAALPPGNSDLSKTAGYNQGNALAMEAFASHKGAAQEELLDRALACYRRALLDNPQNTDARINYEIVLRAIQRRQLPPPPSPAPQGGGSPDGNGQDGGGAVSRLILENARQEEARQMRKYFKPLPSKPSERNQPDW